MKVAASLAANLAIAASYRRKKNDYNGVTRFESEVKKKLFLP